MKLFKSSVILGLISLSTLALAQFTPQWVEAPQTINLVAESSLKAVTKPVNTEQQPVSYHYSLIDSAPIITNKSGYLAESKQYWINTDAHKLSQGIQLPVTSHLAVIRINPLNPNKSSMALKQQNIHIQQNNQAIAVTTFANSEQLKATGMPVSDHTVAFKVNSQPGLLTLSMKGLNKSLSKKSTFVVHVFEPNSQYVLQLKTNQQNYAANEAVKVNSQMLSGTDLSAMNIQGYISQPNGEKFADLNFNKNKQGEYQASISDLPGQSLAHGLWEVHSIASSEINGLKVMRDVSSAFAISMATARFNQQLTVNNDTLKLGLDVSISGRYEVSGVLSGMNAKGEKQPIAMLMTAAQLNKGQAALNLDLPQDLIKRSGLKGPYIIDNMNLKNQSLLVPVQQLDKGIRLMSQARLDLTDKR